MYSLHPLLYWFTTLLLTVLQHFLALATCQKSKICTVFGCIECIHSAVGGDWRQTQVLKDSPLKESGSSAWHPQVPQEYSPCLTSLFEDYIEITMPCIMLLQCKLHIHLLWDGCSPVSILLHSSTGTCCCIHHSSE